MKRLSNEWKCVEDVPMHKVLLPARRGYGGGGANGTFSIGAKIKIEI